jgi:hypothetical protein
LIENWIRENNSIEYSDFSLVNLEECFEICEELGQENTASFHMGEHLKNCIIDGRVKLDLLNDIKEILGSKYVLDSIREVVIPDEQNRQRGEFGENMSEQIAESLYKFSIPIKKRRYAINKEQSLPSTDIIAFKVHQNEIIELGMIETKLRNIADYKAANEAYIELKEKYEKDIPDMFIWTLHRLESEKHELFGPFKRYLLRRKANKDGDKFFIYLIWDKSKWKDTMLEKLSEAEKVGPKVVVCLLKIRDLQKIITHVFDRIDKE